MSEDFEGGAMPTGWSESIGAATQGWTFNDDASSYFFTIPSHTIYACINDDDCECDMSDVWLITDVIDLSSYANVVLDFEYIAPTLTEDICSIKISTNGGTDWTHLASMSQTDDWEHFTINLANYVGESNFKLAFYYSDNEAHDDDYGFAIDDVVLSAPAASDVGIISISPDFVLSGRSTIPQVKIKNFSGTAITAQEITLTDGANYNETVTTGLNVYPLSEKSIKFPLWTPSEGSHTLTATINMNGDENLNNNTLSEECQVGSLSYPRTAYAIKLDEQEDVYKFGYFDIEAQTFNSISNIYTDGRYPMASEYNGSALYRAYSDGSLGIVNPENGDCLDLRKIENLSPSFEPTGLAWDWQNKIMYISAVSPSTGALRFGFVDLDTYEYIEKSTLSSCRLMAIDMADDGFIYGPSISDDKLYKIDPVSGSVSLVGNLKTDIAFEQDVSFDPIAKILYTPASLHPNSFAFGTYNLTTGAFENISALNYHTYTFAITKSESSAVNKIDLSEINISPNPTKGMLNIKAAGEFNVEIINLLGKTLRKFKVENNISTDISELKSGIYFVKLSNADYTKVVKIMKK